MNIIPLALCTLCTVIISKILWMMYNAYIIWRKVKNIPKTNGYPVIGSSLQLIKMTKMELANWYTSFIQYKEGLFAEWVGNEVMIHVYKPEFLEIIFPSTVNIEKGGQYFLLWPWLGKGLLTSTGAQWLHDRKLIGPTFHFNILEQFAMIQSEKAEILTKYLEKELKRNPAKGIDIFPFILRFSLDVICETAMGVNIHAQEGETEYLSMVQRITDLTYQRVLRPWYWIDSLYYLTFTGREYKSLLNALHGFTREIISKKKRERKNDSATSESEDNDLDIGNQKKKAFLDLLLDENEKTDTPLTDDELRAQVDTFMFEGHDTTAVAIIWTFFLLGNNLDHQEKVHEELDQVFKDSKGPATLKELMQLKYLDRVIKEVLRLYPSVPLIARKLAEDVKIDHYTLPKDSTVILPIRLIHRNPEVWPDPDKFDPDRFLLKNSERNRNPYAYVPFSAGPRNCIGQKYAMLELKIVLTAVLRKWRVKSMKTSALMPYYAEIILRPQDPMVVHFALK